MSLSLVIEDYGLTKIRCNNDLRQIGSWLNERRAESGQAEGGKGG